MSQRILIIEDDKVIADGLRIALSAAGYDTAIARDGEDGLYQARTHAPDLIILDIMMPYLNGFELTTELRRAGDTTPIIVLSARSDTRDKVRGFELGADDYVSKPFEIDELLARVRRRLGIVTSKTSRVGDGLFDWQTLQLFDAEGQLVALHGKELRLLTYFLKHPRQLVSRAQIIDAVWGDQYEGTDRTVDNFVSALRKKLGQDLFKSVRGEGYRYAGESHEKKIQR